MTELIEQNEPLIFSDQIRLWNLSVDGQLIETPHSKLLPVIANRKPAILKLLCEDERYSPAALKWWQGIGAARLISQDSNIILIERAEGNRSLIEMSQSGDDDNACRIICDVAKQLHFHRQVKRPSFPSLSHRFKQLPIVAESQGGILQECADIARHLLSNPQEQTILHGDLHHDNILDFDERGWLAIDPKGLLGERASDFANIFINPDTADPKLSVAMTNGCISQRLDIISKEAKIDRQRLLMWVVAYAGLSASWFINAQNPLSWIPINVAQQGLSLLKN